MQISGSYLLYQLVWEYQAKYISIPNLVIAKEIHLMKSNSTWTLKTSLSERCPSQKTMYYMILFMWNVQNRQIYRDERYISGCLGLEKGGIGVNGGWLPMGLGFMFGVMKSF